MHVRRNVRALALAGAVAALTAGPAVADPSSDLGTISATCDGESFSVTTNGGENVDKQVFTPAHDINTSSVFVPVRFENFSGTVFDGSTELFSFTDEFVDTKGNAQANGREILDCSYTFTDTFVATAFDETESGGVLVEGETYTFRGSGDVSGFFTGKKR
jgi:hypothetical protein